MSAISHIKNPLTIIGIFAGIVEISANFVLPFLNPAQQNLYLWFLMLFPAGLVAMFFLTLNFNAVALYAPSDYNNDDSYIQANAKMIGNVAEGSKASSGITWP
ncbi:hypothetical protein [Mixta sp. Marseille-Q2659]|uniref:hypothetical protein n=1 Tax=Mixta sp. Marseille-Q2659 TaxID=2736607 RepID=UPI0023BA321D|nr:hypothetical protein [Mixta sp. Marseille-Q2659]